jgi:hypothetical protein
MEREEYKAYLLSDKWKRLRDRIIRARGVRCERCGTSPMRGGGRLEVHHLTYAHLGNEPPEDLLVVCAGCHKEEDRKRATRTEEARIDRAFSTWCEKRGCDEDDEHEREAFEEWLERKEERDAQ